jgi:hypothetical protein
MKVARRNGNLVITIPLFEEPRPSNSGRSLVIATSRGVRKSKLKVDGRNILYVANAFFNPVAKPGSTAGNAKKRRKKRFAASTKRRRHQDK